jgi:hypothetical protein
MNTIETPTEDRITIHKYILDPLSTIIKLSILSKKNIGCKISVYNNTIIIQEVGVFQSFVRYIYNFNKIDIQYLYNPIELACSYFLNEKNIKKNPNIKNLFIDAQKGILALIETYKNFSIITHTLYLYYNIISNYLGEKFNSTLFMRDNISNIYNKELVDKLYLIWTVDRIKMILDMVDFVDKDKCSDKSVKCLEEFMIIIDKEAFDLIQNN